MNHARYEVTKYQAILARVRRSSFLFGLQNSMTALTTVVRIPAGITPPRKTVTISSIICSGLSAKASHGVHWSKGLQLGLAIKLFCFMQFKLFAFFGLSGMLKAQLRRLALGIATGKSLPITGHVSLMSGRVP